MANDKDMHDCAECGQRTMVIVEGEKPHCTSCGQ